MVYMFKSLLWKRSQDDNFPFTRDTMTQGIIWLLFMKQLLKQIQEFLIKYNHSIENVTITPVEILSKHPGDSKNDMKKRRLSAELN